MVIPTISLTVEHLHQREPPQGHLHHLLGTTHPREISNLVHTHKNQDQSLGRITPLPMSNMTKCGMNKINTSTMNRTTQLKMIMTMVMFGSIILHDHPGGLHHPHLNPSLLPMNN